MEIYCPSVKTLIKGEKECIFPRWLKMVKEGTDGEGTVHLFHPFLVLLLSFLAD